MPTFDYQCKKCNIQFEARVSFNANNPACIKCTGDTQKIFLAPPATHGYMARGREQAMQSLQSAPGQSKQKGAKGCSCCEN